MKKLYIPSCSFNFNSIFSSESISPYAFYPLRGYGMSSADKTPLNNLDNFILLYSKLMESSSRPSSENNYPVWYEIGEEIIRNHYKNSEELQENSIQILKVSETIYFKPSDIRVIFRNETEKLFTISDSKRNLKTKLVNKYLDGFITISQDSSIEIFRNQETINVSDLPFDQSALDKDIRLNRLKGFLYSYVYGQLTNYSSEIVFLSNQIKVIFQEFSGIMTDIQINEEKKSGKGMRSLDYGRKIDRLQKRIDELKKIKPFVDFNIEEYFNLKLTKGIEGQSLQMANHNFLKILKYLAGNSYSFFLDHLKNVSTGLQKDYITLINELAETVNELKYNRIKDYRVISDHFQESAESFYLVLDKCKEISEPKDIHTIPDKIRINTEGKIEKIETTTEFDQELYLIFLNELLTDYSQFPTNDIKGKKIELVERFGAICKEFLKDEWSSHNEDRRYLLKLLDTIKGKSYEFDLSKTNNILVQSFASVILENECLLPLNQLLESVNIKDKSLAMGIWGAISGFSAINKTMFEDFESKAGPEVVQALDNRIFSLLSFVQWNEGRHYEAPKINSSVINDSVDQEKTYAIALKKSEVPIISEASNPSVESSDIENLTNTFISNVLQQIVMKYFKWNKANDEIIKGAVLASRIQSVDGDIFDNCVPFQIDKARLESYLSSNQRAKPSYKDSDIVKVILLELKNIK